MYEGDPASLMLRVTSLGSRWLQSAVPCECKLLTLSRFLALSLSYAVPPQAFLLLWWAAVAGLRGKQMKVWLRLVIAFVPAPCRIHWLED